MAKLLNQEQHDYFVSIQYGMTANDVAKQLNDKFNLGIEGDQIRNYRRNHGIKSGNTGHFEKGRIPHNKGKKFPGTGNSGSFKKGHLPSNALPVGTVSFTTDGYPKRKIAEPNVWEFCHIREWEKHNGAVPEGHCVIFLDKDKSNWNIANLALCKKSELSVMNNKGLFSDNPDMTRAGLGMVRLGQKVKEIE